ncbi:hypothetical protein CCR75_004800 [Bremia lactucae]|uniref:Uncharacterized protein n=1 Tax=Bremia lactucae TaxID=4779 RepID=A0A976FJS4_BRELC|nr:hypothetical protein CCR75_004800 [Bremia lactucae]
MFTPSIVDDMESMRHQSKPINLKLANLLSSLQARLAREWRLEQLGQSGHVSDITKRDCCGQKLSNYGNKIWSKRSLPLTNTEKFAFSVRESPVDISQLTA